MDSKDSLKRVLHSLIYRITAHGSSRLYRGANPALTFVANFPPCLQDATIPDPMLSFDTKALLRFLPRTGTIGTMLHFYFTFWASTPYVPFVPIGGVDRELFFDDVWVSDDHLIGDANLGLGQFLQALEVGRISIAALSLSLTQAVLDLSLEYAQQRRQFGKPISKHQAIQFKLADIATELEAARWLTYRAASLRDAGQPFLKEASMAKLKASRLAVAAASDAVQIHGGVGYMLESPVARFYCDSKVLEIGEGTNEIQHIVIARALGC